MAPDQPHSSLHGSRAGLELYSLPQAKVGMELAGMEQKLAGREKEGSEKGGLEAAREQAGSRGCRRAGISRGQVP